MHGYDGGGYSSLDVAPSNFSENLSSPNSIGFSARIRGKDDRKTPQFQSLSEQFNTGVRINSALYERGGNHLSPGEQLTLVLKNRSTGYMGIETTTLGRTSGDSNVLSMTTGSNLLNRVISR